MQSFHFVFMYPAIFILLCTSLIAMAEQRISLGSILRPNTENSSSWLSDSGLYAFGFYPEGEGYAVGIFLAGIREKTAVWTANRDNPPVSSNVTLLFTPSGMILRSTSGQDINVGGNSSSAYSYASMLDSGNFVLYNSNRVIMWQSFDHPTDTLLPTQYLLTEMKLFSSVSETDHSTGRFFLRMQADGNLVQYPKDGVTIENAFWSSNTVDMGKNISLNLDLDGRLYLLDDSGLKTIKVLVAGGYPTRGTLYFMKVDWDGIFRLYSYNLTQSDSSLTVFWEPYNDKCRPTGICGLNSYCILNGQKPDCECLQGFAYVNYQGRWNNGCERNLTAESCASRLGTFSNTTQQLEHTAWEDDAYSVRSETTEEECRKAWSIDWSCDAALYKNGDCRMQKLPLRFVRRNQGITDVAAFVKVYTPAPCSDGDRYVPNEGKKEMQRYVPNEGKKVILLSCLFVGFLLIILATFGIIMYKYYRKFNERISSTNDSSVGFCEDIVLQSFRYAEIEKMTDGFKEEIGRGSSGTVYKGAMMNGKIVAVKKLREEVSRGEAEFQTEIKVIGRTYHRNLVRLLGYSCDAPNKVLVYEYMSNGSLADILFRPNNRPTWVERLGIAYDIARGIRYLHDECESQIIHCDIKPQNVLMDENNGAKISDFGLAKLMKADQTRTFTGIRGTRGYVAPEWFRNLPVTVKADAYSFGVVLLEIICCRRCVDESFPEDQIVLQDWAYQCFEAGEEGQLVGDEEVEIMELEKMIKVALWCTLDEPNLRPSMNNILLMLEGKVEIPNPPTPLFFSVPSK